MVISAVLIFIIFSDESMCLMRLTTGLPCPTCGMTRASLSLLQLNFGKAFYYHPMVFIVVPALITGAVLVLIGKATKKRCMPWIIALAASLFIVYMIRMILFFPNTEPMEFNEGSLVGLLLRLIRGLS